MRRICEKAAPAGNSQHIGCEADIRNAAAYCSLAACNGPPSPSRLSSAEDQVRLLRTTTNNDTNAIIRSVIQLRYRCDTETPHGNGNYHPPPAPQHLMTRIAAHVCPPRNPRGRAEDVAEAFLIGKSRALRDSRGQRDTPSCPSGWPRVGAESTEAEVEEVRSLSARVEAASPASRFSVEFRAACRNTRLHPLGPMSTA